MRALPKRALTAFAGVAAATPLPRASRTALFNAYAGAVGADLSEAGAPLDSFGTFNDFFARPLREGVRTWSEDALLACPADGRLDAVGRVEDGRMIQAKGIDYGVSELLCDDGAAAAFEGGHYATIYLSPADYHRVHAPDEMRITRVTHEPGELWPVNALSVPWVDGLFRRNERVVFHGERAEGGRIAVVMVAATVVGNIRVAHAGVPHARPTQRREVALEPAWQARRGDEVGTFLLGSTVIVVVEPAKREMRLALTPGSPTRLGAPLYVESR